MKITNSIVAVTVFYLFSSAAFSLANVKLVKYSSVEQALGIEIQAGSFAITSNTLAFGRADLEYFSGGVMEAPPYTLSAIPGTQQLSMFDQNSGLEYRVVNAHIGENNGMLFLLHGDVMATTNTTDSKVFKHIEELAVGELKFDVPYTPPAPPPGGELAWCPTNFGPAIDVQLANIYALQQIEREPNVRVAVSMSTLLRNVSTNDVVWRWSINPPGPYHPIIGQHPYAVFHLYRKYEGSFRQIGKTDVKHAFYSANTECDCPGAQVIFSGCEDVYSVSSNSDPKYFTPRDEVHIFSGSWSSSGSYFDVTSSEPIADDYRSRNSWPDNFTHRLVVSEPLLTNAAAEYYVESWYSVQGDTNNYNNIGYRKVTPIWTNGIWAFSMDTTITNGPVLDAFVPRGEASAFRHHKVLDTEEGLVHLAANITPLGSGMYRYAYALLNLNFDRQLKSFSIPVSSSLTITNYYYGDADISVTNDWSMSLTNDTIRWATADTNGLIWGSMLEFRFDCNVPPSPSRAAIAAMQTGATNDFRVTTLTPDIRISAINQTGATQITWPSVSGAVYGVESSAGGSPIVWIDTGIMITGTAAGATLLDTNVVDDAKLYRLNLLSAP